MACHTGVQLTQCRLKFTYLQKTRNEKMWSSITPSPKDNRYQCYSSRVTADPSMNPFLANLSRGMELQHTQHAKAAENDKPVRRQIQVDRCRTYVSWPYLSDR